MVRRFAHLHMLEDDQGGARFEAPFSEVVCHSERLDEPTHWSKPRRVLCSSLGDMFHEQVPMDFAHHVLDVAWLANFDRITEVPVQPPHQFCFLTKRYQRAVEVWGQWLARDDVDGLRRTDGYSAELRLMPSVWDQASADAACAACSQLPAGVSWGLHVEPMLSAIDINAALRDPEALQCNVCQPGECRTCEELSECKHPHRPSWVVCGGENGPGARPMDPQWALDLRDRCRAAGVPFWFKGPGTRFQKWISADLPDMESTRETPWEQP